MWEDRSMPPPKNNNSQGNSLPQRPRVYSPEVMDLEWAGTHADGKTVDRSKLYRAAITRDVATATRWIEIHCARHQVDKDKWHAWRESVQRTMVCKLRHDGKYVGIRQDATVLAARMCQYLRLQWYPLYLIVIFSEGRIVLASLCEPADPRMHACIIWAPWGHTQNVDVFSAGLAWRYARAFEWDADDGIEPTPVPDAGADPFSVERRKQATRGLVQSHFDRWYSTQSMLPDNQRVPFDPYDPNQPFHEYLPTWDPPDASVLPAHCRWYTTLQLAGFDKTKVARCTGPIGFVRMRQPTDRKDAFQRARHQTYGTPVDPDMVESDHYDAGELVHPNKAVLLVQTKYQDLAVDIESRKAHPPKCSAEEVIEQLGSHWQTASSSAAGNIPPGHNKDEEAPSQPQQTDASWQGWAQWYPQEAKQTAALAAPVEPTQAATHPDEWGQHYQSQTGQNVQGQLHRDTHGIQVGPGDFAAGERGWICPNCEVPNKRKIWTCWTCGYEGQYSDKVEPMEWLLEQQASNALPYQQLVRQPQQTPPTQGHTSAQQCAPQQPPQRDPWRAAQQTPQPAAPAAAAAADPRPSEPPALQKPQQTVPHVQPEALDDRLLEDGKDKADAVPCTPAEISNPPGSSTPAEETPVTQAQFVQLSRQMLEFLRLHPPSKKRSSIEKRRAKYESSSASGSSKEKSSRGKSATKTSRCRRQQQNKRHSDDSSEPHREYSPLVKNKKRDGDGDQDQPDQTSGGGKTRKRLSSREAGTTSRQQGTSSTKVPECPPPGKTTRKIPFPHSSAQSVASEESMDESANALGVAPKPMSPSQFQRAQTSATPSLPAAQNTSGHVLPTHSYAAPIQNAQFVSPVPVWEGSIQLPCDNRGRTPPGVLRWHGQPEAPSLRTLPRWEEGAPWQSRTQEYHALQATLAQAQITGSAAVQAAREWVRPVQESQARQTPYSISPTVPLSQNGSQPTVTNPYVGNMVVGQTKHSHSSQEYRQPIYCS